MAGRPALWALAARVGIARSWTDATGRRRRTSEDTVVALCDALGLPARTERAARATLRQVEARRPAPGIPLDRWDRCVLPSDRMGAARGWGMLTNLYSVRSGRNWGVGDLTDLGALVQWTVRHGGAFVGTNPLHATRNRAPDVSPYSPVSRLFRNWIYLDVTAVPELRHAPAVHRRLSSARWRTELAAVRGAEQLAWGALGDRKTGVLESLYGAFRRRRDARRQRAFARYVEREDPALTDFATHQALEEVYGRPWTTWPGPLRHVRSPAVEAFRRARAARVDYYRWVQFELDRQVGVVARRARRLPIGLIGDLAIGTARDGSDPWAFPDLFVGGASLGAPPDAYAPDGQDWGLPPLNPMRLAETGFAHWLRLLDGMMRHMGGLRIDHVMGLYRQFWIPAGGSPADGTYVRFPGDQLLALLCRESRRQNVIVVGEDLGTVPRGLPRRLQRRGVLSTRMLYFQRDRRGTFLPADAYPACALVSATTHDHAPVRGFLAGTDLAGRYDAGALDAPGLRVALEERRATGHRLVTRLLRGGALDRADARTDDAIVTAAHAFLAGTPATLVGVLHDDLAGETVPVNLPGIPQHRYPSWTRRMRQPLARLGRDAAGRSILRALRRRSRPRGR